MEGIVPVRGWWYLAGTRRAQHQSLLGAGAPTNARLSECTDICTAAGERASLPRRAVRARYSCIADASKPLCLIGQRCTSILCTGTELHPFIHPYTHPFKHPYIFPYIPTHFCTHTSSPQPARQFSPIGERGVRDGELRGVREAASRPRGFTLPHRAISPRPTSCHQAIALPALPVTPTSIAAHLSNYPPNTPPPGPRQTTSPLAVPCCATRYNTGAADTAETVVRRRGTGTGEPSRLVCDRGCVTLPPWLGQTGLSITLGLGVGAGARFGGGIPDRGIRRGGEITV